MKMLKYAKDAVYTPQIQYRKGEQTITAFGLMHVAMRDYYESIQNAIDIIPRGIFEGVKPLQKLENLTKERRKYVFYLDHLRNNYKLLAEYLDLAAQQDTLIYGDHWVNSDITTEEFINKVPVVFLDDILSSKQYLESLPAVFNHNKKIVYEYAKHYLMPSSKMEGIINLIKNYKIEREIKQFLVKERNVLLFDGLTDMLSQQEVSEIGVVYGAGHIGGLNKFLKKNKFKKEGYKWLQARNFEDCPFL